MAYQKQTYQDGVTEYTDTLFEHMDDGIFGAYPVQLIAISDTAPSQCVENDKYYNTSTKKIYTATGTNTWGTTGETPLVDTSYWLISENGNYAWDGTDLVSIGGGKAEVVISDEEPEEGKLWVDTAEIQTIAGRDRLVNVSNSVDEDYRVNLLHSKNLFDANKVLNGMGIASGGTITSATDNGLFYIPVIAGNTYVFSFTDNGVSGNIVWGYTSQVPANGVSCTYNVMANASLNGATFTPTGTQKYLCIRLNTSANNQYKAMGNIQFEVGSTATSYEPYVVPSIYVDNEMLVSKNVYSSSEVVIGEWFGKPLYRKVISYTNSTTIGATGQLTQVQVAHNISNFEKIIDAKVLNTSNQYFPRASGTTAVNSWTGIMAVNDSNIYLGIINDTWSSRTWQFILEYTKTTDTQSTRSIPVEEPEENSR